jgi:hypothetical protein
MSVIVWPGLWAFLDDWPLSRVSACSSADVCPFVSASEGSAMTTPGGDELDPATVRDLVARASDPKRERWLQQVRRIGGCRHPVRLRGVVLRGDERVYSTVDEPDGALMVRCGNRREACCPSGAHEYRGDMWQLVYAGMAGGRKGVPEQVAEHPQVFASLTAPSFGAVHSGHLVTKSRRYSTNLGELRATRAAYRARQDTARRRQGQRR